MPEHLLRQRNVQRHQDNRPVDGVETQNVLADDVYIGGPEFVEQFRLLRVIGVVAERGDIVGKRIDPHIGDMLFVKGNRNAPLERAARNAEILQARLEEIVDHFLLACFRLDKLGMRLDILHQLVRVIAHLEEVGFLLCAADRRAAVGALAVHDLRLGEEGLAGRAVPALIMPLVNIALVIELLENVLHRADMVVVRRADKLVIACAHKVPDAADLRRHLVHIVFGRNARLFCIVFNLLSVLVRAGQEEHIIADLPLKTRQRIGHDDLVGVAEMRLA